MNAVEMTSDVTTDFMMIGSGIKLILKDLPQQWLLYWYY
jgi:hypothetical protein